MCTLSVFAAHHAQAALAERTIVVVSPCKADEVYCEPTIAGSSSSSRTGAGSCVARLMGCLVAQLLQQPSNPTLVVRLAHDQQSAFLCSVTHYKSVLGTAALHLV
jgi:hypothetical protein